MVSSQLPKTKASARQHAYEELWSTHPKARQRLEALTERTGHTFRDEELLFEALTHRSAVMELGAEPFAAELPWNERLEFLGDSVLGLCISRRLMEHGSRFAEGELSRIRAAIVNEESLAGAARRIDLGSCLIVGKGAARTGACNRDSLLADAMEALIGAVYTDGGFEPADALVGLVFDDALMGDPQALVQMDYKTMLQELTQERRITPTYEVTAQTGLDHEKLFEVRVLVDGDELGRGEGASKKRASQAAAKAAIFRLTEKGSTS